MSFCGFVAFSTAPNAEVAESALRRWVQANAASMNAQDWVTANARGYVCTFSLVSGAGHFAEIVRDARDAFVGDVPRAWLSDPDSRARRARLADVSSTAPIDTDLPEGAFSMGVWSDSLTRLTLYRCPLGTRALLYVVEPGAWIAFASLPEPLLALPGVTRTIDETALPSQLIMGYEASAQDATLFARLRRLPAGHLLRFTRDAMTTEEYWRLPHQEPHTFGVNDPEVARALRRLLEAAVRRCVVGASVVGTQLSGGLDSSAVTALAHTQRDANARVYAYTINSHDPHGALINPEERRLSDTLLAHVGEVIGRRVFHHKAHRPYYLFQREYLERPLPDMVFRFGADHRVLAAARADGCDVMLTGWGGDEMVSARGQLHVLAMMTEGQWGLALENLLVPGGWLGPLRAISSHIAGPVWHSYRPRTRWSGTNRDILRDIVRGKPLEPMLSSLNSRGESWSLRRRRRDRLANSSFQVGLELQDWFGQRAGVGVHHPLLDRDVVAFCDRMPAEWVAHLGTKRRAFRAALGDLLPVGTRQREKALLVAPADHPTWRQRYSAHQTRALHDLAASDTWLHSYLNLALLAKRCREARTKSPSARFDPIQQLGATALVIARYGGGRGS